MKDMDDLKVDDLAELQIVVGDKLADYMSPMSPPDLKFEAALAAITIVVERCAKIADGVAAIWKPGDNADHGTIVAQAIAYRIRNLIGDY